MAIWRKHDDPSGLLRFNMKAEWKEINGKYLVFSAFNKEDSSFDDRDSAIVRCLLLDYGERYMLYLGQYLGKSEEEILLYYPQFHDLCCSQNSLK
jgi:hypothetical protein